MVKDQQSWQRAIYAYRKFPDDYYLLTRNKDWWGWDDKWHFEKILVKIVEEENSRRALMETGDADIATEFGPEAWEAFKNNPDLVPYLSPGLAIELLYMGNYGPPGSTC